MEGLREDGQVLEEDEDVRPVVCEAQAQAFPDRGRFVVVVFVGVVLEAVESVGFLLFCEPFRCLREIGDDEAVRFLSAPSFSIVSTRGWLTCKRSQMLHRMLVGIFR